MHRIAEDCPLVDPVWSTFLEGYKQQISDLPQGTSGYLKMALK